MEDLKRFVGKVAIITGAGTGIGKATAIRLAKEGAAIAAVGRRADKVEETIKEIKSLDGKGMAISGNIGEKVDVENIVKKTLNEFGKIDILVNNAAIEGKSSNLLEMTDEQWDEIYNINLRGVFFMTRAVAKAMVEKSIKGKIVNISSIVSKTPPIKCSAYASAKAALNTFTICSSNDLGAHGINVNAICPGLIETPMLDRLDNQMSASSGITAHDLAEIMIASGRLPKGRIGQPEDIANVVSFLVSDDAEYMTGQVINVCGGVETH
ncbi:MAG: hypothetical protein A3C43_08870 [Candidatus Schekmanbacteria bacterium RIFCSPHIGHO2_02_FULL_38_11]|uniref:Beta-ketoacyl-ACP reductase n=1 Tax=Candidatus Schekmanbacteria bacterium RIFCSPLOWO2_12_FULL_38_15 TaxID=1817883 RepID=A0A1F7SLA9_9BACT|nr:MAG: hypothetical protein A2043_09130 [Candidatus Schekmanbacteria bacterium GWA2_38_9]OGL47962.1 MAG: hypothetical protein A3H37_08005 [Candidatus Schekmanbacteria bacterium RIFCSPLOWO2_02_FULL_38_14]OGL49021.1 MAG: hypothetical protein A3C43_08870 [Candidatus Schekmanbacteria bacterium RIFCSPHIGHO2_02_FULL_38_11]OGL54553.1 MAG: hypothetical protein A3G31_10385 [Candidatus Schekmanbacteria bacterium RIFCSPLOWO2_12_FULL_38_15]